MTVAQSMHVVHINLETTWRGGERQVALLVRALARQDVRQTVIARRDGALFRRLRDTSPVDLVGVRGRIDALRRLLAGPFSGAVFHAHTGHAIPVALAGRWRHGGAVVAHRRVAFRPRSSMLARADRVVALSDAVADQCRMAGVAQAKLTVIPPIVDPDVCYPAKSVARRRLGLREDGAIGVTIAALAPEKNVELVLEAIPRVDADVRHYWVGGGIVPAAERVPAGVCFVGFRDDVADWLAAADYVLQPSWTEGFGSVVLDTIAAQQPLILSDIPGFRSWLPASAALWFDPASPAAAAAAIQQCLVDRDRAQQRIAAARQALAASVPEAVASRTLAVYADALKRR